LRSALLLHILTLLSILIYIIDAALYNSVNYDLERLAAVGRNSQIYLGVERDTKGKVDLKKVINHYSTISLYTDH
jgi:hypothetical protein